MHDCSWTWTTRQSVPSDVGVGSRLVEDMYTRLKSAGWSEADAFGVRLAVEEAVVNAMMHGNRGDSRKLVHFQCKLNPRRLWVEVADQGPGFSPAEVPDCTKSTNLEAPNGRGLLLMRAYMTHVEYNASGNKVVMEKHR